MFYLFKCAFGNYKAALPVGIAIEHHHDLPADKAPEDLSRIRRLARQAKPQHIYGRTQFLNLQTRSFAHDGLPPISADSQISVNLEHPFRCLSSHADYAVSGFDQVSDLCFHLQSERRIARRLFLDEIQKVPLRHESEKLALGRQMCKVRERNHLIA